MQQVGRIAPALALTDARRPPIPSRRGASPLVGLKRIWVLRRRLLVQAAAMLSVAMLAAIGFQSRELVANTFVALANQAASGFSRAGLSIDQISITGQVLTGESAIIAALGVSDNLPMMSFDAEAARARLEDLPAVVSASVKKIYPSALSVVLVEKEPVARWRVDGVTFVIDATGEQLGVVGAAFADLPLLVGDGAADDAAVLIEILDRHPLLTRRLVAVSRIADRRWDLIYDNGLRIQLPEQGVDNAMHLVETLDAAQQLLSRDLAVIDLRVPGELALRPNFRGEGADS